MVLLLTMLTVPVMDCIDPPQRLKAADAAAAAIAFGTTAPAVEAAPPGSSDTGLLESAGLIVQVGSTRDSEHATHVDASSSPDATVVAASVYPLQPNVNNKDNEVGASEHHAVAVADVGDIEAPTAPRSAVRAPMMRGSSIDEGSILPASRRATSVRSPTLRFELPTAAPIDDTGGGTAAGLVPSRQNSTRWSTAPTGVVATHNATTNEAASPPRLRAVSSFSPRLAGPIAGDSASAAWLSGASDQPPTLALPGLKSTRLASTSFRLALPLNQTMPPYHIGFTVSETAPAPSLVIVANLFSPHGALRIVM